MQNEQSEYQMDTPQNRKNIKNITPHSRYYPQLDFVKGLAIICVILLHSVPIVIQKNGFGQFYLQSAIPVFFIVIGITTVLSFEKISASVQSLSARLRIYYSGRFKRLILPFLLIFFIDLLYTFKGAIHIGWYNLIGVLPIPGAGNYFISMVFQFIVIAPILFYFYKKSPDALLIGMFSIGIVFQGIAPFIDNPNFYPPLAYCVLSYFAPIALGFYIAGDFLKKEHINLRDKKNLFIVFFLPVSIFFLLLDSFWDLPFWGIQNVIVSFYPLVLFVLIVNNYKAIPISDFVKIKINFIGKASYHIYLIQMLWFGFSFPFSKVYSGDNYFLGVSINTIFDLIITISIGIAFFTIEQVFYSYLDRKKKIHNVSEE